MVILVLALGDLAFYFHGCVDVGIYIVKGSMIDSDRKEGYAYGGGEKSGGKEKGDEINNYGTRVT